MFTGIVTATSKVTSAQKRGKEKRVGITIPRGWRLKKGESVAIDGICTTVVAMSRSVFEVDYMQTTVAKTTAGGFKKGRVVNLERPLAYRGRVDGHFVLGHVDGRGMVQQVKNQKVKIKIPKDFAQYVTPRGSITVNGVALTVAAAQGNLVTVALIPYTASHTNLGTLKKGDWVNIEIDLLARYALRKNATKALRKRR
jgi:riboflavin synthase